MLSSMILCYSVIYLIRLYNIHLGLAISSSFFTDYVSYSIHGISESNGIQNYDDALRECAESFLNLTVYFPLLVYDVINRLGRTHAFLNGTSHRFKFYFVSGPL